MKEAIKAWLISTKPRYEKLSKNVKHCQSLSSLYYFGKYTIYVDNSWSRCKNELTFLFPIDLTDMNRKKSFF